MAISAGNTIINQFVPPICLNQELAQGQVLVWDDSCSAFTNLNPLPDEIVLEDGISYMSAVSTGSATYFLDWVVMDKNTLWVSINGISQHSDSYGIMATGDNSIITFTENIHVGDVIEVIDFKNYNIGVVKHHLAYGDPNIEFYQLPFEADNKKNLFITINGVKQLEDAYEIDNDSYQTKIVFSEPLLLNERIQFNYFPEMKDNSVLVQVFPVENNEREFDLFWPAPGKESLYVSLQGVKQVKDSYDIIVSNSGTKVILKEPTTNGQTVEIIGLVTNFAFLNNRENIIDGYNIGNGAPVFSNTFRTIDQQILYFRNIMVGDNLSIDYNSTDITITLDESIPLTIADNTSRLELLEEQSAESTSPTFTTAIADGNGENIIINGNPSINTALTFKSISAGVGINVFSNDEEIFISSTNEVGYRSVYTNTNILSEDKVIGVTDTSAVKVLTLPFVNEVMRGKIFIIKDETGTGARKIIITVSDNSTIEGKVSVEITENYGKIKLYSNGSKWFLV